jgi:hypothetical protein
MIRKLLLGAGALSLGVGTLIGLGAGAAVASTPVTMSGPITCHSYGTMTFAMALRDGGHTPTGVSVATNLDHCTGTGTTNGPVTIVSGKLTVTSTSTVINNCGAITAGEALPTMTGRINWTTTGGTAQVSDVKFTTPYVFYDFNVNLLRFGFPSTLTAGSYHHQPVAFAHEASNASGGADTALCAAGQPGLKTIFFGQTPGAKAGTVTIGA